MTDTSNAPRLPLVSISIPVFEEEANIPRLYQRLCALAERMSERCNLEFVFTDNHSSDASWQLIKVLAAEDARVKAIRFSKNFGFQRSILANYLCTSGDAVLQIDADLQDPPEMLEVFFDYWSKGYKVVYGVREKRPEGALIGTIRRLGYWAIDKISEESIPQNAGDFRLIDRKVIKAIRNYNLPSPYLRGLISSLGFKQIGIPYSRDARTAGKSKFPFNQIIKLGFVGVFNHSFKPLRLATYGGASFVGISIVGAIYYIVLRLSRPELPEGLASIQILLLFGIGFLSLLLGIIGEYLLRIYVVGRGDPIVIVEDSVNVDESALER